jgi:beta-lactamase regulating signal transducer with metallopeptidase domain
MGAVQHLTGLGLIVSACLRILAAYVLFVALTRLCSRSYFRHALWLLFLTGAAFYWATLVAQVLKPIPLTHAVTRAASMHELASKNGAATTITVPSSWDSRLELTIVVLVCGYAGGVILMLSRLARRRRSLRTAVARARSAAPGFEHTFEWACQHLGVSRCRILELSGLRSPGTAYTWKPLVLVPDGLDSYLDSKQFVDVLYHELIHIRRLDFFWNTLAELVGCVLFFHPVVWLALSKLGRERELACDEAVMELRQGRRPDYALCLTRLARRRVLGCQLEAPSHLALLDSFLALRVQTLLKENRRRSWGKQGAAFSAALLAMLLFFAGWSSLSLAIELVRPTENIASRTVQGNSTVSQEMKAGGRKPHGFSPKARQLPLNPLPAHYEIPREPDENTSLAPHGRNIDVLVSAPEAESRVSHRAVEDRTAWDEAPPTMSVKSPISLRRTVLGAAIGALGQVALGGKDVDRDVDKGGGRSPSVR